MMGIFRAVLLRNSSNQVFDYSTLALSEESKLVYMPPLTSLNVTEIRGIMFVYTYAKEQMP